MAIALATPAVGSADTGGSAGSSAKPSTGHTRAAGNPASSTSANTGSSSPTATAVAPRQVIRRAYAAGGATGSPQDPVGPAQAVAAAVAEVVRREVGHTARHISVSTTRTAAVEIAPDPILSSGNLLVNSGAESGDPSLSGYSSVSVPGWSVTGTPTVIEYGTLRRLPGLLGTQGLTLPPFLSFPQTTPADGGDQFFGGGNVASSSLTQVVDLKGAATAIDTQRGGVAFALSADLGGYLIDPSRASVKVDFLDGNNAYISSAEIGPVTALNRWLQTGLQSRNTTGIIPVGTRSAQVVVSFTDLNPVLGNYNNAYADNVSFSIASTDVSPKALTVPDSNVGALKHVFLVYMENHGVGDIIGSPNAPYINSLVNAYGYAQNYYALTHPSMPNYWPILGGSDFGLNYNCASQCFDQPNLISANPTLTWAAYQDGGGGYTTPNDRTPFLAFDNIYSQTALVNSRIRDISALQTDLNNGNPSSIARFNWIAADDATNMEGPTSGLPAILNWAFSQLTTHQYNVAAGDQFVQSTMSTIMNSSFWSSSDPSAVFLTFDEDYNNISFGIGNEGNHVVMVVIPNQAAMSGPNPMRGGAFIATDYYNHYSLQRTIELALNLGTLTNNDKYAQSMNQFWV
ncbi:alkaline phosphatase family protein [Candidatus Mycolicibacterium alkanivorans]|uniref:Alkaline phosphatase family protein n=1 Tax=Candidatus Mycolicibacterium alkanivorans TaxID=2954114 RepID=A0ABS9YRB5_9MYCO|nr:alkaline phosphatase family protein [Candidatus Mycolicibacterium alkanivorans]MCI4673783.1 alkaline phosphatase family protein [Candidatus Mycolicibacterium alkanivorans]